MNTEEKLNKIKAECQRLLALAEKRTPGKWSAGTLTEYHMVYDEKLARHIARLNGLGHAEENAAYIAACAGAAEAGWRATIAAIDFAESMPGHIWRESLEALILTAWEGLV